MVKQAAAPGTCSVCKETITKRTAVSHLQKNHVPDSGEERFVILVDTPYSSPYWMVILAKPHGTLGDLDDALRDIWVECCGHLSAFTILGTEYQEKHEDMGNAPFDHAKSTKVKIEKVLRPGMVFSYEYDFGTTTELRLKVVDSIIWKKQPDKMVMAAMNRKPDLVCSECGKPAIFHYLENDDETLLCLDCGSNEDLDECYLLPICNSPRTGLCAYEGGRYEEEPE
ncbi:MAG: plasmid pRiA4b ORF-3 family protein [Methanospirillum sp.]|nr:plasmid pRiA4b ORF-3 family protein [Methanospirillum sp.]